MTDSTRVKILALAAERKDHLVALAARPGGLTWCIQQTLIADKVVQTLHEDAVANHVDLPPFSLIATGGYGRREMSPYSDIDITVVPSDEASPILDSAIRLLFQDLHWAFCTALNMDVGYAYRLISDAPGLDDKTQTGLMDMRLVAGSHELYRELEKALVDSFEVGEFLLAKIIEREEMFHKYHDTPLVVEPHLKDGAGGLRCFHCANWLREAIGERASRPTPEYDRILRIRNLLHLNTGKHQDLLTRQRQAEIAEQLHADVPTMMADVVQCGIALHDHYRSTREKVGESRFTLNKGVVAFHGEARLVGNADAGEASVGIALATQLKLRVADLPVSVSNSVRGPAVVFALSTGEPTLRNLDRCGLLKQLLPELDACRTLVPMDPVHEYTVFEHTMRVVRYLDGIESNTFLGEIKDTVTDLEPLYLAALLHDIGKIAPDEDHSILGAEMARTVCERWQLSDQVRETVEWLVLEHLTMARFIRVRDIMNPNTVNEFANIVGDVNRLCLLTLLTWADVSAVAEGTWTKAQDTFLRQLFGRTEARFQDEDSFMPDPAVYRQRLLRQLNSQKEDEQAVQTFVQSLPAHYLTSTPFEHIRLHLGFTKKAIAGEPTVELFHRSDMNATEITVCTLDGPGLLSKLLGVYYAFDLSVGGIRACTTMTDPPVALDVFTVSFSGRPVPSATMKNVTASILDVIEGRKELDALLVQRGKDPSRSQNILRHTYVEGSPGILEVRSPRGRGMPFRLSRLISALGWNVVSARVGQWAGTATAAFYLLGPNGSTLRKEDVDRVFGAISSQS
ncbi:MAG: HD domain-containing protein [Fimbriimonas sp.]|nr:HD domain-containing protein [Fimbriimonas sp.]